MFYFVLIIYIIRVQSRHSRGKLGLTLLTFSALLNVPSAEQILQFKLGCGVVRVI